MRGWKPLLSGLLLTALLLAPVSAAPAGTELSDIRGHWAQSEIQKAVDNGWVDGYPDGTFQPEKTITRAEFTKLLMAALHLTPDSETITRMKNDAWALTNGKTQKYQAKLVDMDAHWLARQGWLEASIASGMVVPDDYNEKHFRPEKDIARYEIALMTCRAMGLVYPASQPLTEELPFTDRDEIREWVRGYVSEATKAGILTEYPDGSFGPTRTATRAEAVAMVCRTMEYIEEGLDPDITTVIQYYSPYFSESVEKKTDNIRLQLVDGRLYASIEDIFREASVLMYEKGYTETKPEYGFSSVWYPIQQSLMLTKNLDYGFQAGSVGCIHAGRPAGLRAPARLLYGELMIPIYDFNVDYSKEQKLVWDKSWDEATNTITIRVSYPSAWHIS